MQFFPIKFAYLTAKSNLYEIFIFIRQCPQMQYTVQEILQDDTFELAALAHISELIFCRYEDCLNHLMFAILKKC